ncbi:MAG: TlpA family protein disulfide reductase [Chloroflexi bacterium]|nr:TlpA family protein disulfide reductase [Chloroflexota bacterium]
MADAAADLEAIHLERAMHGFDVARTVKPESAEAHRQYALLADYFRLYARAAEAWERVLELEPGDAAAWDGYFQALRWAGTTEMDRRHWEKLLQVLPDALRNASQRPELYGNAQETAADLGQLEAYNAVLMNRREAEADNPVFLHFLGAAQVALANREGDAGSQILKDAIRTELDELAAWYRDTTAVPAPILYRLAKGFDFLGSDAEADFWLSRLLAAPDRGVLADDLHYLDLVSRFGTLLRTLRDRPLPAESMDELWRIIGEGMNSTGLTRRAAWVFYRVLAARAMADQSVAEDSRQGDDPVSTAAEPQGPRLAPEYAEALFGAVVDQITWRTPGRIPSLNRLLYYGIETWWVLEEAIELEEAVRTDRPGYLLPGRGPEWERSRQSAITSARVLQARALAQLGETEAAGQLFEELATESPDSQTLGEFGRHLMRIHESERGLEMLVEALAHGGDWRRAADEAAATAGLPAEVVDERLAARQPIVQAELEARDLGERLELKAPDLALADQNGVEWTLRDLTGKVVVLKFWTLWCGHSRAELPHFVELLEKYQGDDEVAFLTVATAGSPRADVNEFLSENGYAFPVLFDDEGRNLDFEVSAYPTTFFLDPDGLIQFRHEGFSEDGYERQTNIRIEALRLGAVRGSLGSAGSR